MDLKIQREALGAYVRGKRGERRLSQSELAIDAGVSRRTVAAVEADAEGPTVETVAKILAALGTQPDVAQRLLIGGGE